MTNSYSWVDGQLSAPLSPAEVNINGKDEKKNVHYVFVPERSQAAVDRFAARQLSYTTASGLASRVDNGTGVSWFSVKRLTYELQDLADVFPTHWQSSNWYTHWLSSKAVDVYLESPIVNESGQAEVATGLQRFFARSRDNASAELTDGRDGIPDKNWFYGAYSAELNDDLFSGSDDFKAYEGAGVDSYGRTRGSASGLYHSHNAFWWQHDYFVHSGVIDDNDTREAGQWLAGAWYTAANGGFDGRWVQLFDDRPGWEPAAPLSLSYTWIRQCRERLLVTASATGGLSPYTFTWTGASPVSAPNDPNNQAYVYIYNTATVTVRSSDGQTRSTSMTLQPYCRPGEELP